MMNLSIILKMLMQEQRINESELARRTGIGQPVINRLASGETYNPKVATLSPIANYFSLSISQLIGDEPLPKNRIPGAYNPDFITWSKVPLLTWDTVMLWPDLPPSTTQLATDIEVSSLAYALIVQDDNMLPRFPEGTILIIDPEIQPNDKDFVIVQTLRDSHTSFKQVIINGKEMYLKTLDPNSKLLLVDSKTKFLGVMVQARMNFKKKLETA